MDNLNEQFGKITRTVREKNQLSQKKLADMLYVCEQSIYSYERGTRMMNIPGFVDFIQMFDEEVVINKNGLSLVNSNSIEEYVKEKENKNMLEQSKSLELIEEKGDISFYEDKRTKKQYQKVPCMGLVPVVDGDMQYQIVESFSNISIRYNLNGVHGYSIWGNEICYEDNFWSVEQTREVVEEMFFEVQKERVVTIMKANLDIKLDNDGVDYKELDCRNTSYFLESLDDAFLDGGIFRCEYFTDIAIPYALNYGEIESYKFNEAIHRCVEEVMDYVRLESKKSILCRMSLYIGDEINFRYKKNEDDNSFYVALDKNNQQLIFKEFYFGCNAPNIDTVLEAVKDDYLLFKTSPTINDYISNRGDADDIETEYESLKADMQSVIKFFGRDYLENLIEE